MKRSFLERKTLVERDKTTIQNRRMDDIHTAPRVSNYAEKKYNTQNKFS